MLDYHVLLDYPAGSSAQIAGWHNVTTHTVPNNAAAVRAVGLRPRPAGH